MVLDYPLDSWLVLKEALPSSNRRVAEFRLFGHLPHDSAGQPTRYLKGFLGMGEFDLQKDELQVLESIDFPRCAVRREPAIVFW